MLPLLAFTFAVQAENWPQWRGPAFNGTSAEKNLPGEITDASSKWKTPLPGFSGASPAVWEDTIFVTSPDSNKDLLLFCVERKDGKVRWQKTVSTGDIVKGRGNMASPSPITDGKAVYALFGTGDLAAYDFAGQGTLEAQSWRRLRQVCDHVDLRQLAAPIRGQALRSGAPALARTGGLSRNGWRCGERESYLLALDPGTGKTLWKHVRPSEARMESLESYASPVPHVVGGRAQLLLVGGDVLSGHDPSTGAELWRGAGINRKRGEWMRVVPSPLSAGDVAIACGPKQEPTVAFRTDLKGDISEKGVAWIYDERQSPDVCTPAYYNGKVYLLNGDKQVLTCLDPKIGAKVWQGHLGHRDTIRSSPTIADGKVYTISEKGNVVICDANAAEFKVLSTYQFPSAEPTRSAIAISNGQLFVRTATALYCLGK